VKASSSRAREAFQGFELLLGERAHAGIRRGEQVPTALLQRAGHDVLPRREKILGLGGEALDPGIARDVGIETVAQDEPRRAGISVVARTEPRAQAAGFGGKTGELDGFAVFGLAVGSGEHGFLERFSLGGPRLLRRFVKDHVGDALVFRARFGREAFS